MTDAPELTPEAPSGERKVLSKELSEFLIELSIALHRHAMYPDGHPSLAPATINVVNRLDKLLKDRSNISVGVAKEQLVIEGTATDSKNPVLSDLAGRLHRHHLGALTLHKGTDPEELQDVLRLVSEEADRTGQPLGLGPPENLKAWPHIRLYPITYERLEMLSGEGAELEDGEIQYVRPAQLWLGLARAAMAAKEMEEELTEKEAPEPSVVANAIKEHEGGSAYDQVIVGYMLQIADELKANKGRREAAELDRRISRMVRNLDQGTLQRLVGMGGDQTQRNRFLITASEGMAAGAVLDLVQAAGGEQQNVSDGMLRMLKKLSRHAEGGTGKRKAAADKTLREQMAALVQGWALQDPNPEGYRRALEAMAEARPVFNVAPDVMFAPEAERMLQMALEVNSMGEAVATAVEKLIEEGKMLWVLDRIEEADGPEVVDALWKQIATVDRLTYLVGEEPLDVELIDRIIPKLGVEAAGPMLDALCEADHRLNRRTLLDRLVSIGSEIAPLVIERLDDERWYVQRNMLNILSELSELPADFRASKFLEHGDARVRREAYKILFRDNELRERSLSRALSDNDDRTVIMALRSALEGCPKGAVQVVIARALDDPEEEIRVTALKVLGVADHPTARDTLLKIVEPKRRSFLGTKMPGKNPEYLQALKSLRAYADDPKVEETLARAAKSKDPDIINAATPSKG